MPRRQFVADLAKAKNDILPCGVTELHAGDDDGQFQFRFAPPSTSSGDAVQITALIPDLSEYPASHEYMLFVDDNASTHVSSALQNIRGVNRKSVFELLDIVAATLSRVLSDDESDLDMSNEEEESYPGSAEEQDGSDDDCEDLDLEMFDDDDDRLMLPSVTLQTSRQASCSTATTHRDRLRSDLRAAKNAGFKIGVVNKANPQMPPAYISLSVRIRKLSISPEAMQAWHIEPSDYLILLIRYPQGYKPFEVLVSTVQDDVHSKLGFRIVTSKHYKPTTRQIKSAFEQSKIACSTTTSESPPDTSPVSETFISQPLTRLLEEDLLSILNHRRGGLNWDEAETVFADLKKHVYPDHVISSETDAFKAKREPLEHSTLLSQDHFAECATIGARSSERSFPLIAMQYMLRRFVRCTEFCLVCHCRLKTDVEALKPYVCDNELCLYQYMHLGFGPSMNHEIAAQPYVTDLLVSFCYASAAARRLKGLPNGLSFKVPPMTQEESVQAIEIPAYPPSPRTDSKEPVISSDCPVYEVGFDAHTREIIFWDSSRPCPIRQGDWIMLQQADRQDTELHCRVKDASFYPAIALGEPIVLTRGEPTEEPESKHGYRQNEDPNKKPIKVTTLSTTSAPQKWQAATFQIYTIDFNKLSNTDKMKAICNILDLLPNVTAMQEYVVQGRELKEWVERISPAGLSILRWIIASNRACIMQVDDKTGSTLNKERVFGMSGYMQFRFAMGAPDKEERFLHAVRKTQRRLNKQHPTIFAFHGSPLCNWHMIVREGLNFKDIHNGRAYGDGVYHAKDANTSCGYSGMYRGQHLHPTAWPGSVLRVGSALAMNEIVNAPEEYVSANPFYVVQHLDWIQTRYLFVRCDLGSDATFDLVDAEKPTHAHAQDPQRIPRGCSGSIVIPKSAIKSSKAVASAGPAASSKIAQTTTKQKRKFDQTTTDTDSVTPLANAKICWGRSDDDSDITDDSDREFLLEDDTVLEMVLSARPGNTRSTTLTTNLKHDQHCGSRFVPGTLDFSTLPVMELPTYAISPTTKTLLRELNTMAKLQATNSLDTLGWYIDTERIENVYQWIVELHSFDGFEVGGRKLPLALDMEEREVTSIVMEIRFNKDFPYSPPFVRVIRPRFLTLAEGGGGHIVAGGAMCMELLTNTGWSSVSSMDSVLMQIRLAIASEPFARLAPATRGYNSDYGVAEGADGYIRACRSHGWEVPDGFREMAFGLGNPSLQV